MCTQESLHVHVYIRFMLVPKEDSRGFQIPITGVAGSCEPLCGYLELSEVLESEVLPGKHLHVL